MSIKKRVLAVFVVLCLLGGTIAVATLGIPISEKKEKIEEKTEAVVELPGGKKTLYLWYTDEALTDYVTTAAVSYNENHEVRIVPVLQPGLEYLESINSSSIDTNQPDLYVISHDSLEKAYLAGLATEVTLTQNTTMEDTYPGTAINAATYEDKLIGYPFYFETNTLLYNKTYLRQEAQKQLTLEAAAAEAETAEASDTADSTDTAEASDKTDSTDTAEANETADAADTTEATEVTDTAEDEAMPDIVDIQTADLSELSEEQMKIIDQKVAEILPATIEDIKDFADTYDAPEQVESVFKWDVNDIFYNYFFIGNAVNLGGEAGWDTSKIDIYNDQAVSNMQVYQDLNQFFSIDTSEISYDSVLDDFIAGKLVFTVATSDAVAKLEQAKQDGSFAYDYGFTQTPDISDEVTTRSLSMTQCVAINGYSTNKEAANDFAYYLTVGAADILFARSGKVAAATHVDSGMDGLQEFTAEYAESIPMPKMIETSNFWVQLEVAFAQIWDGADVDEQMKQLSEQIMSQVAGN